MGAGRTSSAQEAEITALFAYLAGLLMLVAAGLSMRSFVPSEIAHLDLSCNTTIIGRLGPGTRASSQSRLSRA
jgi:hypothetical protein